MKGSLLIANCTKMWPEFRRFDEAVLKFFASGIQILEARLKVVDFLRMTYDDVS